ncbi:MAG TPA: hypothetical protein VI583_03190 [Cyclobacteriaceae bacterium]|nr:hypothetical protein [Cyclobacteriaceae bacterium]
MNGTRLAELIVDPGSCTDADIRELTALAEEYPYFSCLHILNAKIAFLKDAVEKDSLISRAAIISADRQHLKKYITTNEVFANYTFTALKEPPAPVRKQPETTVAVKTPVPFAREQTSVKPETPAVIATPPPRPVRSGLDTEKILEELKANTELYRKSMQKYLEVLNRKTGTRAPDEKVTLTNNPAREEDNPGLSTKSQGKKKPSTRKMPKEEQDLLINRFIEAGTETRKPGSKSEPAEKTEAEDLSQQSDELSDDMVTETLALIMINQGKLEKAIDIYHKLIWKLPQKRGYFAAQIEILKEKISQQK